MSSLSLSHFDKKKKDFVVGMHGVGGELVTAIISLDYVHALK